MSLLATKDIAGEIEKIKEEVLEWRRYLHQHPELSFQEFNTSNYIRQTLESMSGLEISRPTETSVMARLKGPYPGKTLALRADIDALPIQEETNLPFSSLNPGVMHACGHDMHSAMLLGAAKILAQNKDQLKGEVRFIFQHAEEVPPGGARELVKAGVIDGVDMIVGMHIQAMIPVGMICMAIGPMTAASDTFDLEILGKGGHGSRPHSTIDSIAIAAEVIGNLQYIVSRNTAPSDPLVISVTKIHSGEAYNVIPGIAELGGTVRYYQPEFREKVPALMERVIKGIVEAHGGQYRLDYRKGYGSVSNDPSLATEIKELLTGVFGTNAVRIVPPQMGSEDFSEYLQDISGCYIGLGAGGEYPQHHPKHQVSEEALWVGLQSLVQIAGRLLG